MVTVELPVPDYEELGFSMAACAYCGEAFVNSPRSFRYCPQHRHPSYRKRVSRGRATQANFLVRQSSYEEMYFLLHAVVQAYSGERTLSNLKRRILNALQRADGLR
jgi:hypothetical protein